MSARRERGPLDALRADNLRRRWHVRHLVPIAAAAGCALLTLGVVVRPAASLADARRVEAGLRRRALEARSAEHELARFAESGGFERVAELEERARAAFPDRPSAVELHAALVLAARASGVLLADVHLGASHASGLELFGEQIVQHEALVAGRARLGALLDFADELEACGYPLVLRRAALQRAAADDVEFGFALELGLVGRAPRALRDDDGGLP